MDSASPVKVLSAAAGTGAGGYTISGWDTSSLAVSTPANLRALQSGESYRADLLWTLSSGP
jgi:hypothetical protein